jgi:hypothetical protein
VTYPLRHISLRVPWHDTAWDGRVCANPRLNSSCLKLRRIAEGRNDAAEEKIKARLLSDLPEQQWPCCIGARGTPSILVYFWIWLASWSSPPSGLRLAAGVGGRV